MEPSSRTCPECLSTEDDDPPYRIFTIVVPLAFRTNLWPGADAQEDNDFLASGASSFAQSTLLAYTDAAGTNTSLSLREGGRVYRINDGPVGFSEGNWGQQLERETLGRSIISGSRNRRRGEPALRPPRAPNPKMLRLPRRKPPTYCASARRLSRPEYSSTRARPGVRSKAPSTPRPSSCVHWRRRSSTSTPRRWR